MFSTIQQFHVDVLVELRLQQFHVDALVELRLVTSGDVSVGS